MKNQKSEPENNPQAEVIAEMMLAKTVLEEKNELLAHQERTIRNLQETVEALRAEGARWRESGRQEGSVQVVAEAARLAVEHLRMEDRWSLAARLIRHFQERYGLEVIEQAGGTVDPELHQVVEVVEAAGQAPSLQILAPGFRLNGKTVQPALVRVIRAKAAEEPSGGSPAG